ncbi:hypothetical protein JK635_02110 [Neobacillus sp. YIM B02564]|uniref:Uncharacterized protein n=1 Tax=Neobacillus paridis TaxID=2803862 RepID=A0ABS1TIN0_9BACI|nr:hypothetical protein [Neobacillus paridis]MBL4951033.1 hypothetical protein [Neobacillus paridis]
MKTEKQNIRGIKLIDNIIKSKETYSLYFNGKELSDLAAIDNFKWYSVEKKANNLYIKEIDFTQTDDRSHSLLQ